MKEQNFHQNENDIKKDRVYTLCSFFFNLNKIMSETIAFKPETLEKVKQIIARYPEGKQKSALIPVLHLAQKNLEVG
jgi:hypothetical protein